MQKQEKFIAVVHDKGGVGKSTTVIHLAAALEQEGREVIVCDGDRIQALRNWAKLRSDDNSFPVMGEKALRSYKKQVDYVIFDTAGGIQEAEVTELIGFVDFFILPTNTDAWAVTSTYAMATKFLKEKINFRVLINRVFGNYSRGKELQDYFKSENIPIFEQMIPRSALIEDAINAGKTVFEVSGARAIADRYSEVAAQTLIDIKKSKRGRAKEAKSNE